MDIGIGPLGDLPGSRTTPAGLTSEVVETATRAEALGFDAAWVGERHFAHETVTASAPFTLLGALAGATESIRLGTSISVLPLHHPVRLAEQVATLDAISDGRVTLGGGIGYMDAEYETFGADADRRVGELLDCVEVVKEAAAHEPLDYDGYCHDFEGVTVEPRYTQEPRPPIWLGGTVPASIERAATVADGFLGAPTGTETYEAARPIQEEACDDYEAFRTGAMVNVFVADSTEAALETVEPGLLYLARRYARWIGYEAPDEPDTSTGVYGTPAEVVEGLREYVDILGEENTHLLVRLHYPDVDREKSDRSLELFADEVLPEL